MKVGIYAGTFDPVHQGHIGFCRAALQACRLDQLQLLPEAKPRGKTNVTSLAERLHMLELAVADEPAMHVLQLPHPQFTVARTLPLLTQRFEGDQLFFLVGSDVVRTFTYRWPGLPELLSTVHLVVGLRKDDDQAAVQGVLHQLQAEHPALALRYTLLASPYRNLASFHIRRTQQSEPGGLHPRVAAYIADQRLYAGQQLP